MTIYKVELYDKDNDIIVEVHATSDIRLAKQLSKYLYDNFIKHDCLLNPESKNHEPFDWVQVYDTKRKAVVFVNNGKE